MSRPILIDFDSDHRKKTPFKIVEMHAASRPESLNEEWIVIENASGNSVGVRGCSLTVAAGEQRRPHSLGTIEPGFILEAGMRMRLVSGSPANKAQGTPPVESDEVKNYHLFLKESYLGAPGLVVRLTIRQLDLAHAVFAPESPNGVV